MGHYIYKYTLDNEIIYVGKCDAVLKNRIYCHGRPGDNIPEEYWNDINNADIHYAKLPNSIMTDVYESVLIQRYKPRCNSDKDYKKKCDWKGIDLPEPKWDKFDRKILKAISNKKLKTASFEDKMAKQHPDAISPAVITPETMKHVFCGRALKIGKTYLYITFNKTPSVRAVSDFVDEWYKSSQITKNSYVIFEVTPDQQIDVFSLSLEARARQAYVSTRIDCAKRIVDDATIRYVMPSFDIVAKYLTNPSENKLNNITHALRGYREKEEKNKTFKNLFTGCCFIEATGHSHILHYKQSTYEICWAKNKELPASTPFLGDNTTVEDEKYQDLFIQEYNELNIPLIRSFILREKNKEYFNYNMADEPAFNLKEFLCAPCTEEEYRWAYTRNDFRSKVLSFIESELSNNGGSKEDKDFNRLKSTYKINGTKQHDMSDNEFRLLIGAL